MRNVLAVGLSSLVLVSGALLTFGAPASAHGGGSGCRVFADVPQPPEKQAKHPQLFAWAEVHCSNRTQVVVRVCALDIGKGALELPSRPVWCTLSSITAPAGRRAFAKTLAHDCTVGSHYVTVVWLNGISTDRGPWGICHGIP